MRKERQGKRIAEMKTVTGEILGRSRAVRRCAVVLVRATVCADGRGRPSYLRAKSTCAGTVSVKVEGGGRAHGCTRANNIGHIADVA